MARLQTNTFAILSSERDFRFRHRFLFFLNLHPGSLEHVPGTLEIYNVLPTLSTEVRRKPIIVFLLK